MRARMREWLLVPACLLLALLYAGLDADAGLRAWRSRRSERAAAEARIRAVSAELAALRAEVDALRSEPFAVERAIREDLRFARPGETLVVLPRSGDSSTRFP